MKFGAHAFIWEGEWNAGAARRVIEGASAAGLDFVELPMMRPQEFDAVGTRRLLEEADIGATCSLGLPVEASLPERPAEAERFLKSALEKARETGASLLTGVTYATLGELPGRRPTTDDYATIAACLKRVARHAAGLGMRLGIEPVNRYETYLINTARQGRELLERIGEPNLFLHLDTYHLNIEEDGYRGAIVESGDLVGYVHLSESHRGTPGTGTVDWDEVFAALRDIGFAGDLVMESFVKLNPDIARATCMWRDIVKDPQALVRDGLAFLRGKAIAYGLK